jgi:hypothetical protein
MDQILLALFLVAVGFGSGYAVRASISRRRRARAKSRRTFFDNNPHPIPLGEESIGIAGEARTQEPARKKLKTRQPRSAMTPAHQDKKLQR